METFSNLGPQCTMKIIAKEIQIERRTRWTKQLKKIKEWKKDQLQDRYRGGGDQPERVSLLLIRVAWNFRGVMSSLTIPQLKEVIWLHSPDAGFRCQIKCIVPFYGEIKKKLWWISWSRSNWKFQWLGYSMKKPSEIWANHVHGLLYWNKG